MPEPIKLHNSLTRKLELLAPIHTPQVGLYTCGPTVYNYAHIGNYRTYIFEDVLGRGLGMLGYQVKHVMNITDVGHLTSDADTGEDKMEVGARRTGKTAWEIAEFYTAAFFKDYERLNCRMPDVVVKATDYVFKPDARWDMIRLIQALEKKGLTYRTSDGVYFDTAKFPRYGELAGAEHLEGLKAGARVEASPEKKNPTDFALWKFSPKNEKRQMEWDSPWGRGFPGWHIECSAMSMDTLGETFDVHCGGIDHIPVHHTNEIAQAEGATGKPLAKLWLHGEFLVLGGKAKMAKSADNFLTLDRLIEEGKNHALKAPYDPLAYRYLCLTAHYRTQLEFGWAAMDAAQRSLDTLRTHYWRLEQEADGRAADAAPGLQEAFIAAVADDLNMPKALSLAWSVARSSADLPPATRRALLGSFDRVLGLGLDELTRRPPPATVLELIKEREGVRSRKDFAAADVLRSRIVELGYYVEDTPEGSRLVRKA